MNWTIRVEGAAIQWHTFALQSKDGATSQQTQNWSGMTRRFPCQMKIWQGGISVKVSFREFPQWVDQRN